MWMSQCLFFIRLFRGKIFDEEGCYLYADGRCARQSLPNLNEIFIQFACDTAVGRIANIEIERINWIGQN